jgi:hypothetical protein
MHSVHTSRTLWWVALFFIDFEKRTHLTLFLTEENIYKTILENILYYFERVLVLSVFVSKNLKNSLSDR